MLVIPPKGQEKMKEFKLRLRPVIGLCIGLMILMPGLGFSQDSLVKVQEKDAKAYFPPGHFKMKAMGLHNPDVGTSKSFAMGMSIFEPGGGADSGIKPVESVYFVLEGELTVTTKEGDIILGPNDSVYRPAGVEAGIINKSDKIVKMLVIGPPRPKKNEQDTGSAP